MPNPETLCHFPSVPKRLAHSKSECSPLWQWYWDELFHASLYGGGGVGRGGAIANLVDGCLNRNHETSEPADTDGYWGGTQIGKTVDAGTNDDYWHWEKPDVYATDMPLTVRWLGWIGSWTSNYRTHARVGENSTANGACQIWYTGLSPSAGTIGVRRISNTGYGVWPDTTTTFRSWMSNRALDMAYYWVDGGQYAKLFCNDQDVPLDSSSGGWSVNANDGYGLGYSANVPNTHPQMFTVHARDLSHGELSKAYHNPFGPFTRTKRSILVPSGVPPASGGQPTIRRHRAGRVGAFSGGRGWHHGN